MKLYHGTDLFSAEQILQKGIDITQGEKGWTLVQGSMLRLEKVEI